MGSPFTLMLFSLLLVVGFVGWIMGILISIVALYFWVENRANKTASIIKEAIRKDLMEYPPFPENPFNTSAYNPHSFQPSENDIPKEAQMMILLSKGQTSFDKGSKKCDNCASQDPTTTGRRFEEGGKISDLCNYCADMLGYYILVKSEKPPQTPPSPPMSL